jgi:hypothetical protein
MHQNIPEMKTISKILLFLVFGISVSMGAHAGKKVVKLTVSEPAAKIYVNNRLEGTGQMEVVIPSDQCVTVQVEKTGFLKETIKYCNKKGSPEPPKTQFVQMERDDAWDASEATDMVNADIEMKTSKGEVEAWKLVSEQAGQANASVKSDELFKEWDRVLKKYKEFIHEIQTRLGN